MLYVKIKSKGQVTLPMKLRRELGCDEGDMLEATLERGTIVLRPRVVVDSGSVEEAIAEGLADYKQADVRGFR